MGVGASLLGIEREREFFYHLFAIGAVIMPLQRIAKNPDRVLLQRAGTQHEGKINDFKAENHDHQQREPTRIN